MPIFFIETLADLSKKPRDQRAPEEAVANIAARTPVMHCYPNVHHATLCLGDLLGHRVKMDRRPMVGGGRPVRKGSQTGIVFERSAEIAAFSRWQEQQFYAIEHDFARLWRAALDNIDLRPAARLLKNKYPPASRPRDLGQAREMADAIVAGTGQQYLTLQIAYNMLGLDPSYWPSVLDRWKGTGRPRLREFAPYAAYVFTVDIFFYLCIWADLISPDRPSNKIDMAYLYYLPFCMLFVSSDKLHQRVSPFLMSDDQEFVSGPDLKRDLAALDRYYSSLPEETKLQGLLRFAARPPDDPKFLTSQLWNKYLKRPVRDDSLPPAPDLDSVLNSEIAAAVREWSEAMPTAGESFNRDEIEEPSNITFKRSVPLRRGKWRLLPPEVERGHSQEPSRP